MSVLRFIPLLILFAFMSLNAEATLMPHNTLVLTGAQNAGFTKIDPPGWSLSPVVDLTRKGVLTLGIDHHYPYYMAQSVTEVKVFVAKHALHNGPVSSTETKTLRVSYYPIDSLTYQDESTVTFDNVEKLDITVLEIKVNGVIQDPMAFPANVYLQGDVFVDRIYNFANQVGFSNYNLVVGAPVNTDCVADGVNDELTVSWGIVPGAEEYQLEWTFVNTVGLSPTEIDNLKIDFRNNSTRISTKDVSYKISLLFDKGFVVFRVRAVGRSSSAPYNLLFSTWSILDGEYALNHSLVIAARKATVPFDNKKNWQYTATYAEEGKKKEIVSFFDGSLRNRQMVTKISTDRNAIVGETIYDHQGRPAVQVLPVPVPHCESEQAENSLRYYPNFNKNENNMAYSKTDFDISSPGDSCNPIPVGLMKTNSGASNYYSSSNPNKVESQAFVPEANGYPFSQVEYTPDNTGRIRRQGGVGKEFQLSAPGATHPTQYFYAHPLQEQLDRLFGSEVGDASHYQKNMVVDPNGEVSVSYLDQEGRVIATSLAGQPQGTGLMPLPSSTAIAPLVVDLFAKDGNGNSTANKLSFDGMSKEFNQTLALSSPSSLKISYDIDITRFKTQCLGSLCLNCVYDLSIEVKNTCGELQSPVAVSSKMIGRFNEASNGTITFRTDCKDTTYHNEFETEVLPVGTYQITKTLTVNQQALETYLQMYTDPNPTTGINTCITNYSSILDQVGASSNIDDCDEDFSCAQCVQNLGSLLEYVMAGGTEEAYNEELEACNAPCKGASYYENMRQIMMMDVNCDGQYGQYLNNQNAVNVSIYPVSVLNHTSSNKLRDPYPTRDPNWKFPVYDVEATLQYAYFDEDGVTRSRIPLTNVTFSPTIPNQVATSTPAILPLSTLNSRIFLDNATGEYYTYPEYLNSVNDFITYYSINRQWANSLVYYHPEYAYLEKYKEFYTLMNTNPSFPYSSEAFDMQMQSHNTWATAQAAKFVVDPNNPSVQVAVNDRINKYWIIPTPTNLYPTDEFALNAAYMSQLTNKINSYATINGVTYSMMQVAALMNRGGNSMVSGAIPASWQLDFGKDAPGYSAPENVLLRDAEWMTFRGLYLAEKQRIQKEASQAYAFNIAYNGCIGNDSFNPFENGFLYIMPLAIPFFHGQFMNITQPCSVGRRIYYINKQPRFGNPLQNIDSDPSQVAYQLYLQTGQCPIASSFQRVLNEVTSDNNLVNTGFSATNTLNTLTGLVLAMQDFETPASVPALTWTRTTYAGNTGNILQVALEGTSSAFATFTLMKTGASPYNSYNWTDIVSFNNLHFTQINSGLYEFTIKAKVDSSGVWVNRILSGTTTLKIGNCTFPEVCELNDFGKRLKLLTQTLAQMGKLSSTTDVDLTASPYDNFMNNTVKYTVNSSYSGGIVKWKYTGSLPGFLVSDPTSSIAIKITNTSPASFSLSSISSIAFVERVEAGPNNTMKLVCHDAFNNYLVTLSCELLRSDNVLIPVGKCGLDDAILCTGVEYDTYDDLMPALVHSLETQNAPFNLYNPLYWTSVLTDQLVTEPTSIPGTITTGLLSDSLLTYDVPDGCKLVLSYNGSSPNFRFNNIVSVDDMELINQNGYGSFNEFKLYVTYTFGGNSYEDSITGTSCFKMKRCTSCTQTPPNVTHGPAGSDQTDGVIDVSYVHDELSTTVDNDSELYCLDIYEDYVEARANKIAQLLQNGCSNSETTFPLLSYNDFVGRNFCCESAIVTAAYFIYNTTIISPTDCNATNPSFSEPSCEILTNASGACGKVYTEYTRYITFFNSSSWAQANNVTLTATPSGSFDCVCYGNYIMYLLEYISASSTKNLSYPLSIADYCAGMGGETGTSCASKYDQYVSCTKNYNDNSSTALPIVDFDVFMENNLCHCLDEYCSNLSLTLSGFQAEQRDLLEFCKEVSEVPCVMDTVMGNFETFEVSFDDACTEFYQSNNEVNAQIQYNEQIQAFYTQLGTDYIAHCMKATEKMSMEYKEIEHHYTLYYYDQAGNLIKTVPPEGVEFLDLSNTVIKNGILADRLNNTHKVITSHRMATTYLYNSLNQLVAQNMPDQDAMKIFEPTLPSGLPVGLTTTAIQMLDANQGYLTGYMDATGIAPLTNRGYLYRTTNGGQNWVRITNTLGTDLREVQMASATLGYAMSSNGLNLITKDGGSSWDLVDMLPVADYADCIAMEVLGNDAYFLHRTGRILKVNSSGVMSTYHSSLPALTGYSISQLKDFTLQNSVTNLRGIIYLVTLNDGTETYDATIITTNTTGTQFKIDKTLVGELNALSFYSATEGFAAGADGNISSLSGAAAATYRQRLKKSDAKGLIDQIHMLNATNGIARITENGVKVIRRTTDGGATWIALSQEYTDANLSFNRRSANGLEVLIQGYEDVPVSAAYCKNVIINASGVCTELSQNPTIAQDLKMVVVSTYNDGTNLTYFGIRSDGTNYQLYRSNPFTQIGTAVSYVQVATLGTFVPKELVIAKSGSGVAVEVLATNGIIYRTSAPAVTGTYAAFAAVSGTASIVSMDKITILGLDYFLAYRSSDNKVYGKAATATGSYTSYTTSPTLNGSVIRKIAVHGSYLTLVGTNGGIFTVSNVPAPAAALTFTDRKSHQLYGLKKLKYASTANLIVGENGQAYTRPVLLTAESTSMLLPLGVTSDLNAMAEINPSNPIYIFGGKDGALVSIRPNGVPQAPAYTTGGMTVTAHLNGKTINDIAASGFSVFIAGDNGSVYHTPDFSNTFFAPAMSQTQQNFLGVAFITGQKAIAVGTGAEVFRYNSSMGTRINQVFGPKYNDVHFENGQIGTLIGDHYFVRSTMDGGTSWKLLRTGTVAGTTGLKKVWTKSKPNGQHFAVIGAVNYVIKLDNGVPSQVALSGTVNDMQFSKIDPLFGYLAYNSNLAKITLTWNSVTNTYDMPGSYPAVYTATSAIQGLHVLENKSVVLVGGTAINYYRNSAPVGGYALATVPGVNFRDVSFIDNKVGLAVGDAGKIYSLNSATNDALSHDIVAGGFSVTPETVTDPDAGTATYNITALAFSSQNTAIYGGGFANTSDITSKKAMVRFLKYEQGLYTTRFYYDRLGRIVVSQNSRQLGNPTDREDDEFSYTLYDGLGRVIEAGGKFENFSSKKFPSIFGTYVGGTLVPGVVDDTKLQDWLDEGNYRRFEVTKSYYDKTNDAINTDAGFTSTTLNKATQRKRIVHTTYSNIYSTDPQAYDHATHYDYDIHGNVKTLIQDNRFIRSTAGIGDHRLKRMDYIYDLVSGNVHRVDYQTGAADQWHHAYSYDADNRITDVYTSLETPLTGTYSSVASIQNEPEISTLWDKEVNYQYYEHGPLARTLLGEQEVQGIDYVYTLQGWIKDINSNSLNPAFDPGGDGNGLSANRSVAKDVYGYSLHYFENDYRTIGGNNNFVAAQGAGSMSSWTNLYNGNIGAMVTTITDPDTRTILPLGNTYRYDQLNRLRRSSSFNSLDLSENSWNVGAIMYQNDFEYDANGNITSQVRYDDAANIIDDLTYRYMDINSTIGSTSPKKHNRLYSVLDDYDYNGNDIDPGQSDENYVYDAEGRLIQDEQEELYLDWFLNGKVRLAIRPSGSSKKTLSFAYDAMGHRIGKGVYASDNGFQPEKLTYYVLDAQGNVMSTYEQVYDHVGETVSFAQTEKHIYGASRLGVHTDRVELLGTQNDTYSMAGLQHHIGAKNYELTNHLGNVLSVISDKIVPEEVPGGGVVTAFNDQFTTNGDALGWAYAPAPDYPLVGAPPAPDFSLTATGGQLELFAGSTSDPTDYVFGFAHKSYTFLNGVNYTFSFDLNIASGEGIWFLISNNSQNLAFDMIGSSGSYSYTFTGNGATMWCAFLSPEGSTMLFDNIKLTYTEPSATVFLADIRQSTDYSPFGVKLEKRDLKLTSSSVIPYRYAFNGMEKDDELKGSGNSYDFGARMYDPRLGRWLTIDPLAGKYPSTSPYTFVANSPLIFVDPDGERIIFSKNLSRSEKREYKSHIKVLRQDSPTFKKMYADLKKSKNTYTFDKTGEHTPNGDQYDCETRVISVNLKGNEDGYPLPTVIAHETGHAWRHENNLDVQKSESPYTPGSVEDFVFAKKVELFMEFEGLHIENIVRSELGLDLRKKYGEKSDFKSSDKIKTKLGSEYADFSKAKPIMVGQDSNYNYEDKTQDHYQNMKGRKHTPSEINVDKHEDPKKFN